MSQPGWTVPLMQGARSLLQLFLPSLCPLCREQPPIREFPFCVACTAGLVAAEEPWCPRCAVPYAGAGPSHPCPRCTDNQPPFDQVRVWGVYTGNLAKALQRFKYSGQLTLRAALQQLAVAAWRRHYAATPFTAVVPVPSGPATVHRRGFDLAALLAREAARAALLPCRLQALRKVADVPDLVRLSAAQRRRAVARAYAPAEELSGEVLLVDDVVTTTATARACAAACLAAGASRVRVLAVARTPAETRGGRTALSPDVRN